MGLPNDRSAVLSPRVGRREVAGRVRARAVPSAPVSPRFLRGYVDLAITGVLEYERFGELRAGPWRSLARRTVPAESTTHWERQVLERRLAGDLAPWATLRFVVGRRRRATPTRDDLLDGVLAPGAHLIVFIRDRVPPVYLEATPHREHDRRAVATFLWDVAERFRRQLD